MNYKLIQHLIEVIFKSILLLFPWFCCKNILLLFFVVAINFIHTQHGIHVVGHHPCFLGYGGLGVSACRSHRWILFCYFELNSKFHLNNNQTEPNNKNRWQLAEEWMKLSDFILWMNDRHYNDWMNDSCCQKFDFILFAFYFFFRSVTQSSFIAISL